MLASEAADLIHRVIHHPYTTEVGESARLGRLATDLAHGEVSVAGIAKHLKITLTYPSIRELIRWVERQRKAWIADNKVRREKVSGDAQDTTSPVATHGKVLPPYQHRRGRNANNY
jgi:hypothetical protein